MENKGVTKKQLRIQIASMSCNLILGLNWFIGGLVEKKTLMWIIGALFLLVVSGCIISFIIQRGRYPIEDEELDKKITRDFKDGIMAIGIIFGIVALVFLFAFGLYALIK